MFKRLFYAMMAGAMLFTTSCEKNFEEVVAGGGVSINIGTPHMATRYGKALLINELQYAVYQIGQEGVPTYVEGLGLTTPLEYFGGTKTINLSLVNGATYQVVFWADNADAPYTFNPETAEITVDYADVASNQEKYDAFFAATEPFTVNGVMDMDVTLTRPFAQLNIGTSNTDFENAQKAGLDHSQSSVTVPVYNTLNLISGDVDGLSSVTFDAADIPTEDFLVAGHKYIAMNYLLVKQDVVTVELNCSTFTREFLSVPVQRNYRTNIYGSLFTSNVEIYVECQSGFGGDEDTDYIYVQTDEELAAALALTRKEINIVMEEDLSFNLSSKAAIGGDNTQVINIEGNGHKLTLTTSYSSDFTAKNPNAKIVLKNMDLTSSKESGTWDLYDIGFCNDVELENVDLLKSVAFDGAGKSVTLKNVTITESHDYYAMWITAEGQTVNIDGLTVNAPDGRGIKIDDEYVEKPAKVSLNIKKATFTTAKKAAIVVDTPAGATITAENIDITNVAADSQNAVWVDEDAEAYDNEVVVTGATKTIEGATLVANWDEFTAALANNASYIMLGADISYDKSYDLSKKVTINLNGKSLEISDPAQMLSIYSVSTIKNGTIKGKVYARANADITFDGVTFGGTIAKSSTEASLQIQSGCNNVVCKKSIFNAKQSGTGDTRPISVQSSSKGSFSFYNCDIKSNSKQKQVYVNSISGSVALNFTGCKFGQTPNIEMSTTILSNLTITGNTSYGCTITLVDRTKDQGLTDAELSILRALKTNNSFTQCKIYYAGGVQASI